MRATTTTTTTNISVPDQRSRVLTPHMPRRDLPKTKETRLDVKTAQKNIASSPVSHAPHANYLPILVQESGALKGDGFGVQSYPAILTGRQGDFFNYRGPGKNGVKNRITRLVPRDQFFG